MTCHSRAAALCATLLAAMTVWSAPAAAQDTSEVRKRELRRYINRTPAVLVNPAVVQRVPDTVSDAATTAAATPAPTDQSTVDAPVTSLRRGELAHVELNPESEHAAKAILTEQLAATGPAQVRTLRSFEGAVRQLATDNSEVQLKSYVLVGQPLQYSVESGHFIGTVLVGAADLFGESGPRTLTVPLVFEVLESALADPARVELKQTSPPYERIRVTSRVVGQPVTIRIASNFSREGVQVLVPIEPTLLVNIDGGDLRAWGMQAARVTVTTVGLKPAEGTPLQISAPGAFLTDEAPPAFDKHGVARATLRTDAPGTVKVTASADLFAPGFNHVEVVPPWFTLFVICVGGLLGGLFHLASKRLTMRRRIVSLVISTLFGAFIFAVYTVTAKLFPVDFKVEVGDTLAFVVAGLGSWLGIAYFKRRITAGT